MWSVMLKTAVCIYNKHNIELLVIVLGVNRPLVLCFVHTDIQMHIWELFNGAKWHENNLLLEFLDQLMKTIH